MIKRLKWKRLTSANIAGTVLMSLLLLPLSGGYAADNDNAERMKLIDDTASSICGIANESGEASSESLKGKVDTEVNGLARKLLNAGITGTGDITPAERLRSTGSFARFPEYFCSRPSSLLRDRAKKPLPCM